MLQNNYVIQRGRCTEGVRRVMASCVVHIWGVELILNRNRAEHVVDGDGFTGNRAKQKKPK